MLILENNLSNEEKILFLEKKGLIFHDEDKESIFSKYNYFDLINKYGEPFYDDNEGKFNDGTNINIIIEFMEFNYDVGALLYRYIGKFERRLKTAISNVISSTSGEFGHHKKLCFNIIGDRKAFLDVKWNINKTESSIYKDRKNNVFLIDDRVPVWILVENMSLGQLLFFEKSLKKVYREKIYTDIEYHAKTKKFNSRANLMREYRNRISHSNPIFLESVHRGSDKTKPKNMGDVINFLSKFNGFKNIKMDFAKHFIEKDHFSENLEKWLNIMHINISHELKDVADGNAIESSNVKEKVIIKEIKVENDESEIISGQGEKNE